MAVTSALGDRNIAVFDVPHVARQFDARRMSWYGDLGERTSLLSVADDVRDTPILDIGVGGGRTTLLLRLLSADYVAVDAAPNMVALFRSRYPDFDVRLGDARDLSDFDADRFGLVMFSNNGLDAVDHDDRARVLAAMARVVRPGGVVLYSTHNVRGPSFGERPWRRPRPEEPDRSSPRLRSAAQLLRQSLRDPGMYASYWRNRRLDRHEGWAMGPLRAHGFRLVTHFVGIDQLAPEVQAAGLRLDEVFSFGGRRLHPDGPESRTHYFHVVARKPGG